VTIADVDAAIDADDAGIATRLADLLDKHGEWDWEDSWGTLAIVESSGAWWVVYRGTEPDQAWRHRFREAALANFDQRLILLNS